MPPDHSREVGARPCRAKNAWKASALVAFVQRGSGPNDPFGAGASPAKAITSSKLETAQTFLADSTVTKAADFSFRHSKSYQVLLSFLPERGLRASCSCRRADVCVHTVTLAQAHWLRQSVAAGVSGPLERMVSVVADSDRRSETLAIEHDATHEDYPSERASELIGAGMAQGKAWRQARGEHRDAIAIRGGEEAGGEEALQNY